MGKGARSSDLPLRILHVRIFGSGLIDPEDHDGEDGDSGHEGVGAPVVASGDAPPVFQACEQFLDPVTTAVDGLVVRDGDLAAAA